LRREKKTPLRGSVKTYERKKDENCYPVLGGVLKNKNGGAENI